MCTNFLPLLDFYGLATKYLQHIITIGIFCVMYLWSLRTMRPFSSPDCKGNTISDTFFAQEELNNKMEIRSSKTFILKADKKKVSRVAQERRRENVAFSIRSGKEAGIIHQVSTILQKKLWQNWEVESQIVQLCGQNWVKTNFNAFWAFGVNFSFRDVILN